MSEKVEKIAIIDLGSNTARLVLVNVYEGGFFVVFDELKETVRLGQDMDIDGFLRPSRIEQTKKTLLMFRRFCDSNGIEKILAYATAAVRRAKNQKSFLEEVSVTCGIKLKVLTSEEEGLYTYTGVINSMGQPTTDTLKVEHLNDMLVRTIVEFSYMPECAEEPVTDNPSPLTDDFIPNPFDASDLEANPAIPHGEGVHYLLDVSGKLLGIYEGEIGNLNEYGLPQGIYFIKTYIGGQWFTRKIMVR